jgi:hypothetical protein
LTQLNQQLSNKQNDLFLQLLKINTTKLFDMEDTRISWCVYSVKALIAARYQHVILASVACSMTFLQRYYFNINRSLFIQYRKSLMHVKAFIGSRVSSGSIVSDYWLDDRAIGVRSPAGAKDFSSSLFVQTGSVAHPASCTMGTGGSFLRG